MTSEVGEFDKVWNRPAIDAVPGLFALEIEPRGEREILARRLRELFAGALQRATVLDFGAEELDIRGLPSWFVHASSPDGAAYPEIAEVANLYMSERSEEPWNAEDWLSCLDPGLRRWGWWDVTRAKGGRLIMWVDAHGESHFPNEELYWAAFASGARRVSTVDRDPQEWLNSPSAGLDPGHLNR